MQLLVSTRAQCNNRVVAGINEAVAELIQTDVLDVRIRLAIRQHEMQLSPAGRFAHHPAHRPGSVLSDGNSSESDGGSRVEEWLDSDGNQQTTRWSRASPSSLSSGAPRSPTLSPSPRACPR
eukprot:4034072-Pyramimonas_sp.AAC.1